MIFNITESFLIVSGLIITSNSSSFDYEKSIWYNIVEIIFVIRLPDCESIIAWCSFIDPQVTKSILIRFKVQLKFTYSLISNSRRSFNLNLVSWKIIEGNF
jgi:hypothetical protein